MSTEEPRSYNIGTVTLLAILPALLGLWGCGHIYMNRAGLGVVLLVVGLSLTAVLYIIVTEIMFTPFADAGLSGLLTLLSLAWLVGFIGQAVNARKYCEVLNREAADRD